MTYLEDLFKSAIIHHEEIAEIANCCSNNETIATVTVFQFCHEIDSHRVYGLCC